MDENREAGRAGLRRRALKLAPLALVAVLLAAFFASGAHRYVSYEALKANYAELTAFVDARFAAAIVVYIAVYAFLTGISFPAASLMTLLGGLLFGWLLGATFTVAGATAGATVVFLAARTSLGEALWERVKPYAGRMEQGFRENEFSYLLFLRLLPVFPFWAVNLAPAFLGVATRRYVATTCIGIVPGTVVYTAIGDGLGEVLATDEAFSLANAVSAEIVLGLAGLAILSLAPVAVKRIRARRERAAGS